MEVGKEHRAKRIYWKTRDCFGFRVSIFEFENEWLEIIRWDQTHSVPLRTPATRGSGREERKRKELSHAEIAENAEKDRMFVRRKKQMFYSDLCGL